MMVSKRSARPCFWYRQAVFTIFMGHRPSHLENGTDVDLIRIGEADEFGVGLALLQVTNGPFLGWVLIINAFFNIPSE